jgi:hypothetical protein
MGIEKLLLPPDDFPILFSTILIEAFWRGAFSTNQTYRITRAIHNVFRSIYVPII